MKLFFGDSFDGMAALAPSSVDLIIADLPYGITHNKWDCTFPLEKLWAEYWRVLRPNGAVVLHAAAPFSAILLCSALAEFKHEYVWVKENGTGFLNATIAPLKRHEQVLVFGRKAIRFVPQTREGFKPYRALQGTQGENYSASAGCVSVSSGSRHPISVLEIKRDVEKLHPTQKPVELAEYLIRSYSLYGETVLDNCMGSGTTGVAAKRTGRDFIGIENSEKYFAIAERRIGEAAPVVRFCSEDKAERELREKQLGFSLNDFINMKANGS